MKYLLLSICCLLFTFNKIDAQNYSSMLPDTIKWHIASYQNEEVTTQIFKTPKSTVFIDGIIYFKIENEQGNVIGFLREDLNAGKTWFFTANFDNDEEILIMDLSLDVGDEFEIDNAGGLLVTTVTSRTVIDDKIHIEFDYLLFLEDTTMPLTFIEGIGPNAGFTYISNFPGNTVNNNLLLCTFVLEEEIYKSDFANEDCDFEIIIPEDTTSVEFFSIQESGINVFPNPATDFLYIQFDDLQDKYMEVDVVVYNLEGKVIFREKGINTNSIDFTHKIETNNWLNGSYILQINTKDKSYLKQIIKM